MRQIGHSRVSRIVSFVVLVSVVAGSMCMLDRPVAKAERQEHMYFPSGKFLKEASLGFRNATADYLWFRFIQYYGAFAKDQNDFRHFDVMVNSIVELDPKFVEAYYFASLVRLSDFGDIDASIDFLKKGILHNPEVAKLHFQIGFMHYVFNHDYQRAAYWFEAAGKCPDASDKEKRFAAFARYRAGDSKVSLELWKILWESTQSPQMKDLAEKMINKIQNKIDQRLKYGDDFVGPLPGLI